MGGLTATIPTPRVISLGPSGGRPRRRTIVLIVTVAITALVASTLVSTAAYLRLPAPTGPHAVGRLSTRLADPDRAEPRDPGGGARQVGIVAWYPSVAGTGRPAGYLPGLDRLRDGLVASGQLTAPVVAALGAVSTSVGEGADPLPSDGGFPVVLLSPGNATNVATYAILAEELASRGYVVIGVDHPYQVAAVDLGEAGVAVYEGDLPRDGLEGAVARRIAERRADLDLVLDRLAGDALGSGPLVGALDLSRVAVVGHSNGGIAAAELCAVDGRVDACVNIDGQAAGGPFASVPSFVPPGRPFLFLTKERDLHVRLRETFEAGGRGTYRVVLPVAAHADFADGARFDPRLTPMARSADAVQRLERDAVADFLDHELRGLPGATFGSLDAPTDVYIEAYPLGDQPTLPG
jgi:alpha-beta hydrolase superfamily lysophospholipase